MEEEVDEVERKSEERREKRERERERLREKREDLALEEKGDVRVPSPQKIRWNLLLVVGQNRIKAV